MSSSQRDSVMVWKVTVSNFEFESWVGSTGNWKTPLCQPSNFSNQTRIRL